MFLFDLHVHMHAQKIRAIGIIHLWRLTKHQRECCIRSYHVFKDTREAEIGEELECVRDPSCRLVHTHGVAVRPEPIILLNLPIILFQISHKLSLLFFQDGPIIIILFSKHGHVMYMH